MSDRRNNRRTRTRRDPIFAGFGIAVFKHANGTYSIRENGYQTAITRDHAALLAARYNFDI
jgi:hypothetical protein